MKKLNFKDLFLPGIVLFSICLVTTFLLAYTNQLTKPKIDALLTSTALTARQKVLPAADSFVAQEPPLSLNNDTYEYFQGLDKDGNAVGYVFTTMTKGYGGDVEIMSGIDDKGKVAGIEILQLSETPGLGMKAYDKIFLDQFSGKSGSLAVSKTTADEKQIQALTGATITSKAVTGAVNIALKLYDLASGKSGPADGSAANADEMARKQLLPAAASFEGPAKVTLSGEDYDYYTAKNAAGTGAGYIFETGVIGYNGIVLVHTAVDSKGVITGVKVVSIVDTSPAETSVDADSFINQFVGKSGKVNLTSAAAEENSVQAITGATVSSGAVVNAVNKALELYKSVAGGNP